MVDSLVLPEPWAGSPASAWSALRKLVPHDAAALLLVCPKRPDPAAILGTRAVAAKHLKHWLHQAENGDPGLRQAARLGVWRSDKPGPEPAAALPPGMHAIAAAERSAPRSERYWALVLGRKKLAFTLDEQARMQLALSLIRGRFESPPPGEPGTRRVLADPAGRLMHVDLRSRLSAGGDVGAYQSLVEDLLAIEAQRWPGRPTAAPRDLFPPLPGGVPTWVRLSRLPAPGDKAGGAVYLTLRPIHGVAPPPVGLIEDPRIAQAVAVLTDHYADAPRLNDLAARFGVSPFHFQRLFTAQAGVSPKHLVLRVQLLHARSALRMCSDPIQQIAKGCGFSSHGHFTATFHRLVGVTPLEYRLGAEPPGITGR